MILMTEMHDHILKLIKEGTLSSIELISKKVGVTEEETIEIIEELIKVGKLDGHFSEDKKRFFKSDVKLSEAPAIPRDEKEPDFIHYNTRPGKILIIIGFITLLIGGIGLLVFQADILAQEQFSVIALFGIIIMMAGGYQIGSRKTP